MLASPHSCYSRCCSVLDFCILVLSTYFLDGGDVSLAFYEGFRQLGSGTIPIEGPNVPGAYPSIVVHYSFAVVIIKGYSFLVLLFSFYWSFVFRGELQALRTT